MLRAVQHGVFPLPLVLVVLFASAAFLAIGCMAWGAKEAERQAGKGEPLTNITSQQAGSLQQTFAEKCPRIIRSDRNGQTNPHYFAYQIDTSNGVCPIATKIEDLLGEGKLFVLDKHDSFVLANRPSNKSYRKSYIQHYKGIEVVNYGLDLNYQNGKITSVIGTFYPNIDIDTTGMISREAASKIAIEHGNFYPQFMDRIDLKGTAEIAHFGILPHLGKVFYSFEFNKLSQKPGTYIVNAVTGKFHSYVPADYLHEYHLTDCYQCVGGSSVPLQCEDTCTVNACSTFADHRLLSVPTLYNDCQNIRSDSCNISGKIVYRMAPLSIGINDSINVYDGSNYYAGFPAPPPYTIKYCYTNGVLSKKMQ